MSISKSLMERFADETGLSSNQPSDRYLWTDAFAVCTYLGFYQKTSNKKYLDLALKLVDEVHSVLGSYREDDERSGRLGTNERPTSGGLRIGKSKPERMRDESLNRQEEWQRDGQYFHYITKWIHALVVTGKVCGDRKYYEYAKDLAKVSMKFVDNGKMYWKMSTDLSYPLVPSMGKHDPLDGYITFQEVMNVVSDPEIAEHSDVLYNLISRVDFRTTDSLGLGGLLFDVYRLNQLDIDPDLADNIIKGCNWGLGRMKLMHQLAFRELGLAIGLQSAIKLGILPDYYYLRDQLNSYWIKQSDFTEHRQINTVMLATSLQPSGFLQI